MIKVVHLITMLEFGGAQGNVLFTVRNLNPEKFEVYLWSGQGGYWDKEILRDDDPLHNRARFFKNLVRHAHPLNDLKIVFDLAKALKKIKPDVLHTHSSKAGIVGRLAGKWVRIPFILHTYHGFGFNNQQNFFVRWFYIWLERWAAHYSHKLIFVSESNKRTATKLKIGKPSQYELIRSGVDIRNISNRKHIVSVDTIKKGLEIPLENKFVINISALKPQKNLLDYLKVASLVRQQIPNVSFLIVGDGIQRKKLEGLIEKIDLKNTVKILGWRQDAIDILSAADVFALTSLWEGLPRAMVEAMILEIPVVCYDTDGVRDLLSKGGGVLISQGDQKTMAEQIIKLLLDKNYGETLSVQAKQLITNDFNIHHMVSTQESLYLNLLSSRVKHS